MAKPRPRVLAIASAESSGLVREALEDRVAVIHCIDLGRLRRDYGAEVASEVLRQLVSVELRVPQRRTARRKSKVAGEPRYR